MRIIHKEPKRSCNDLVWATSRKLEPSYLPLKKSDEIPYSWKVHVAAVTILVGVTLIAMISLTAAIQKQPKEKQIRRKSLAHIC